MLRRPLFFCFSLRGWGGGVIFFLKDWNEQKDLVSGGFCLFIPVNRGILLIHFDLFFVLRYVCFTLSTIPYVCFSMFYHTWGDDLI